MTHPIEIFMLIATSLCFLFAAVNVRSPINLIALGLFFLGNTAWLLSHIHALT